jgi:glycine/D-amino acid oxidase-like deaminating enzyme
MPEPAPRDVIVVGAGVVGASIAFHLARDGARVTLIDKGEVCAGMSARSGALLRMHYTFAPEADLAWKSLRYFAHWHEMVGGGSGVGGCGFVRTGFAIVVGSENADRLRANIAMIKVLGIDTELADARALREIDPAVNVEDVALAAYEPQSGYADPIATTHLFADAAGRLGATIMLRTPIVAIITSGGRATGVIDAVGRRHGAGAVCIVAGPWTERLLKPLGVQIGLKAERAQIAFFRRAPEQRHLAYIDTVAGSYFRPHGSGLTLAGLGDWRHREGEPDPDDYRRTNDDDFIAEVGQRLGTRIPAMSGAPFVHGHAGIYDVSPDARAVMGRVPGVEGLYVAAGFSGTGFKTSPAVGAVMVELILTGTAKTADVSAFSFERILSGKLIHTANEYAMGGDFDHTL